MNVKSVISISAQLLYKTIHLSSFYTVPSAAPDMLEATVGQRDVVFSWCPPPPVHHNGVITSYILSCFPSPTSLPLSTFQSGVLTVMGFTPDKSYSCSVVARNNKGSGPAAYITFKTVQDCK